MEDVDQNLDLHPATAGGGTRPNISSTSSGATLPPTDTKAKAGIKEADKSSSGPIPMSMPSILRNPGMTSQSSNHLSYLVDRHAGSSSYPPTYRTSKSRSTSGSSKYVGRQKQRRSENARLLSNPHATRPTLKDYKLQSNEIKSTFHASSSTAKTHKLAANLPVPENSGFGYSRPTHDPLSANQGHFGKSLRDAQKVLKKLEVGNISDQMIQEDRAGDLERFIWLVDREIRSWSTDDVHVFESAESKERNRKKGRILIDSQFQFTASLQQPHAESGSSEGREVAVVDMDSIGSGQAGQLIEFQRTPNALVWLIHDSFLRLVVHCLARVYNCPSFSKDDASRPGLRFTWILNKNPLSRRGRRASVSSSTMSVAGPVREAGAGAGGPMTSQNVPRSIATVERLRAAPAANGRLSALRTSLETPPTTDFDSQTESELEAASDFDGESLSASIVMVNRDDVAHGEGAGTIRVVQAMSEIDDADVGADADVDLLEDDGNGDGDGDPDVGTDEEEAEILRRVRRWAIDSHRQRAHDAAAAVAADTGSPQRRRNADSAIVEADGDRTLTATTIQEADDEGDSEDEILVSSSRTRS